MDGGVGLGQRAPESVDQRAQVGELFLEITVARGYRADILLG